MSTFPNSPRVLKGAIIGIDPLNPLASVVIFQYNPDTMTRKLEPRAVSAEGDRGEAFRLTGAPKETITLSVEIDATDQLELGQAPATSVGIYPTLAALEMLVYPKTASSHSQRCVICYRDDRDHPCHRPYDPVCLGTTASSASPDREL